MPKGKVLVVEDEDTIRLPLIEYLKEHSGLEVAGARDGVDALHQVSTKKYDVVILDVMMPYMTGIDFLDSLEALTSDPSIKHLDTLPAVIVITAASPEHIATSDIEHRFPSIVRAVLRKPLNVGELAQIVAALLP
ncbi:MAG: response regulator [Thermoanaerobaculia bacterium]